MRQDIVRLSEMKTREEEGRGGGGGGAGMGWDGIVTLLI